MLTALASGQIASRIWRRDPAVFVGPSAGAPVLDAIAHRLGWLDAPGMGAAHADDLAPLFRSVRDDGLPAVILLGRGGSSLCADVLRDVPADRAGPGPDGQIAFTRNRNVSAPTRIGSTAAITKLETYHASMPALYAASSMVRAA